MDASAPYLGAPTYRIMPRNRGPQPNDAKLFGDKYLPILSEATDDLCWLLERGYNAGSAMEIVGNRYRLNARQRLAVARCAAAPTAIHRRKAKEIPVEELDGQPMAIDGFNLLILLESARGGAVVLEGRDGTYRDMASVHGTYKKVRQTREVLVSIGQALTHAGPITWYFDRPVSNSGKLKTLLRELGEEHGFGWSAELVFNPDRTMIGLDAEVILVSSDSWILDEGSRWCNLGRGLVEATTAKVLSF